MSIRNRLLASFAVPTVIAATAIFAAPAASATTAIGSEVSENASQMEPMGFGSCPDDFIDWSYSSPRFVLVDWAPGVPPTQNPNYVYGRYVNIMNQFQYRICGPV